MTQHPWIILEDTMTTITRLLPNPAGGAILQRLIQPGSSGECRFVLDVNAMQALRDWIRSEETARPAAPCGGMTLGEMATILRTNGWLVREAQHGSSHGIASLVAESPPASTVLEHCLAADQARQGVAVRSEVVELMERACIPFQGLWSDHAAEIARRWPERWPAPTAAAAE